jgi:hypothetical protein
LKRFVRIGLLASLFSALLAGNAAAQDAIIQHPKDQSDRLLDSRDPPLQTRDLSANKR